MLSSVNTRPVPTPTCVLSSSSGRTEKEMVVFFLSTLKLLTSDMPEATEVKAVWVPASIFSNLYESKKRLLSTVDIRAGRRSTKIVTSVPAGADTVPDIDSVSP